MKKFSFINSIKIIVLTLLCITVLPVGIYGQEANESNSVAYSEKDNVRTYYRTVTDAVNASMNNNITIVMTSDWVFNSPMNVTEGKTLRIEMNGHTISRPYTRANFPSSGQVIVMHPNSELYLIGSKAPDTHFNIHSNYTHRTLNITSGGLVYEGRADEGGGIYMKKGSKLHLDHVAVAGNKAKYGGGIYVNGQNCYIYMENGASIENNDAEGGGIYSDADGTHIYMESNSRITNNDVSPSHGGAVYFNYSWFSIESKDKTGVISNNVGRNGGAIYVCSRTFGSNNGVIRGLTIKNNEATNYGGALYLDQNNILVEDCTIIDNEASYSGGGIYTNGKNTLKNVTITGNKCNQSFALNNNDEGGGVYCASGYDLTLSGKVTIKNNYRMNANLVQWWNPDMEGGSNYRPGHYGYSNDDVFLGGSSAYLIANNLDSSSLVGIRTGQSDDKKCVKGVSSYDFGQTFFLDLGSSFHIGFESKDKEIWQRKNATKYTVTINGKEVGKYDYDQEVTVSGDNVDGVFTSWTCENFELTDEQKKSTNLTFKMPSYDVNLIANYNTAGTDNVAITVDSPVVGENLASQGKLTWTINNVGHASTIDLTWYDKDGNVVTKAEANKTYHFKTSVNKDGSKYLVFSTSIGIKNVKVTYNTLVGEETNYASSASVDSNGTLSIQGFDINSAVGTYKLVNTGLSTMLEVGTSKDDVLKTIPDVVTYINAKSGNVTKEFKLDKDKITFPEGTFDSDNKLAQPKSDSKLVTLTIPVIEQDDVILASNTVSYYILVTSPKTVITKLDDVKVEINEGASTKDLLDAIKDAKNNIKGYVDDGTTAYTGSSKIGIRYTSDSYLTKLFEDAGLLKDGKVVYLENGYTYSREATISTGLLDKVTLGENAKNVKFIINVKKTNTQNEDNNQLALTSVDEPLLTTSNDDNSDKENQEVAQANIDSNDVEAYSDDNGQTNEAVFNNSDDGYIELSAPSVSTNKSYFDKDDIDGENVVLVDGVLKLNIKLSVVSIDEKTRPAICYNLYTEDWTFIRGGESNDVTLSATSNKEEAYILEVYSKLDDEESAHQYIPYTIDNTSTESNDKTITLTINYTDGTPSKTETLAYTSGSSFYFAIPIIDGYSLNGFNRNNNTNVVDVYLTEDSIDRYIYDIRGLDKDISVSATYTPVITKLDIEMDDLTVGEKLPSIGKIWGFLIDDKTKVDLTNFFTTKTWSVGGEKIDSDSIVLSNTQYELMLKGEFGTLEYFFMGDIDIKDSTASAIGINSSIGGKNEGYVDILLPTTSEAFDNEISFTLSGIKDLSYPELSYEQALTLNKVEYGKDEGYTIVDNYNLPSKLFVTLDDDYEDALDITWNKEFTTSFDPNNYGEQELVIEGVVSKPDYIKADNFNNKITLKIKVKAKYAYVPEDALDNSSNKAVTCEEYMKSKDWTWSESKKACVYKVSNTNSK